MAPSTGVSDFNASAAIVALLGDAADAATVLVVWRECLIIGFPAPARAAVESVGLAEELVGASP